MSDGFKDIRDASQKTDAPLREMLSQMRQALHWLRDNTLTIRELRGAGLADERGRLLPIDLSQIAEGAQGPAGEQGPPGAGVEPPDLTQPPTPTGLTAVGALASVIAQWGNPSYTAGHGHKQTNIYATKQPAADATLYTIADAVRVSAAPGAQTIASVASDPDVKWRIWIKWESNDGVESDPAGGVNGVVVTTGQDVSALLAVLSGELTATQLASSLATPIALIPSKTQTFRQAAVPTAVATGDLWIDTGATNLLLRSQEFDNAYWGKTGASVAGASINASTAPDGTLTADKLTESGANSNHYLEAPPPVLAAGVHDLSVYAKAAGRSWICLGLGPGERAFFDLATGAVSTVTAGVTASSVSVGDGWFRISINRTVAAGATPVQFILATGPGTIGYTGDGVSGVLLWGAMLREGALARYVPTEGAPVSTVGNNQTLRWSGTAWELSDDARIGETSAAVTTEIANRISGDSANASAINTVNARLNSGGDVAGAIVSVNATASTALTNAATADGKAVSAQSAANAAQGTANTANALATANASLITTVQSSLANASGNRVSNSSFELDSNGDGVADGFLIYNNSGMAVAASRTPGRLGGYAQKIDFTGTANASQQGIIVATANQLWEPGKTYVAAFYAKAGGAQVGMSIATRWSVAPQAQEVLLNPVLSTSWQRYAFKFTMQASLVEPDGLLHLTTTDGWVARNGPIEFDDVTIYEGTELLAYEPGRDGGGLMTAAVQTEATTRASQDGLLFAKYGVKLDVNGYTIGWAANNDGVQGTIVFRTDTFIVGGTGYSPVQPFIIRTSGGTEGGVSYPAGVYMDSAYITNLTAMWARFGTLVADSVQATEISAARLTVGTGAIGGNLRSTTYTGGSIGWIVRPDGYAEFNNVVVRGTVYASAGAIGGSYIGSTYIQSTTWVSGSNGWRFNSDGTGWVGGIYMDTTSIRSANYILNSQGFALRADGTGQIGGLKINATNIESSNYVAGTSGMRISYNGDVEIDNLTARGNITASSLDALTADIVQTIHVAGDAVGSNKFAQFQGYTPTGWNSLCSITQTGFPANSKSIVFFELYIQHLNALSGSTATLSWAIKCNGVDIYGPVPTWTMTFGQSRTIALRPIAHTSSPVAPVYSLHVYASNSDVYVDASITVIGVKK